MRVWLAVLCFIVLGWVAACARSGPSVGGGPPAASGSASASAPERKLVRSAELRLEVDSYAPARSLLDQELARVDGYVADARVQHADGAVAFAHLELRVPAGALDGLLARLMGLGVVLEEVVRSNEITDEYHDGEARLANARAIEARLLAFADSKTTDLRGLLEVERELGRVREEIEVLRARLAGYASSVALSAVSLDIESRERESRGVTASLGARLGDSFRASWHALLGSGRAVLVGLALLAPWLPALGLGVYLARRLSRRWRWRT